MHCHWIHDIKSFYTFFSYKIAFIGYILDSGNFISELDGYDYNLNWLGGDLMTVTNVLSPRDCQANCSSNVGCVSFVYRLENKLMCFFSENMLPNIILKMLYSQLSLFDSFSLNNRTSDRYCFLKTSTTGTATDYQLVSGPRKCTYYDGKYLHISTTFNSGFPVFIAIMN